MEAPRTLLENAAPFWLHPGLKGLFVSGHVARRCDIRSLPTSSA